MGFKARVDDSPGFSSETFGFLIELEQNNDRDWFHENKEFYERAIKSPLLSFIESFAPSLQSIAPNFDANKRSMFRIYRDVRFSKDKRPYKTHAAAHFRHKAGKDVHAPGFYLHIEPGKVFAGAGVWQPSSEALDRIRKYIVAKPKRWQQLLSESSFEEHCELHGNSLKRPPRGFDREHPLIEDLKRKDFIALVELDDGDVMADDFVDRYTQACRWVAPFNRFLCDAVGVPF